MAATAVFLKGKPIMQDAWPSSGTWSAGDVIIINDHPFVAHEDNPPSSVGNVLPGGPAQIKDALAVAGGIYQMAADAAYPNGIYVYYNPVAKQITSNPNSTGACVPFGWLVGGPGDQLYDGGPTGAAGLCSVHHDPTDDSGLIYNVAPANTDTVTAVAVATAFANTVTIPAGTLVAGDAIHVRVSGFVKQQNGNDTNLIVLNYLSNAATNTVLANSTAINAHNNAVFIIDCDLIYQTVGNSGLFNFIGDLAFGANATRATIGALNTAVNTNFNTVFSVIDTQSSNSASNIVQLTEFVVEKKRK